MTQHNNKQNATFSIMTLSITTLSIMTKHSNKPFMLNVVMLSVIMLSVIMLSVVAPKTPALLQRLEIQSRQIDSVHLCLGLHYKTF